MYQAAPSPSRIAAVLAVVVVCCSLASTIPFAEALAPNKTQRAPATTSRRGLFESIASAAFVVATTAPAAFQPLPALAEQVKETRQGNEVTAFNGLAFNYRGGEFSGLDASTIDEPTITYKEFNEKLKAGEVSFVEFLAPDGDVAYATLKGSTTTTSGGAEGESSATTTTPPKTLRIGEGYPIEQHDGYSSPLFCVRSVKNAGVPYKFTVKGLAKYSQ